MLHDRCSNPDIPYTAAQWESEGKGAGAVPCPIRTAPSLSQPQAGAVGGGASGESAKEQPTQARVDPGSSLSDPSHGLLGGPSDVEAVAASAASSPAEGLRHSSAGVWLDTPGGGVSLSWALWLLSTVWNSRQEPTKHGQRSWREVRYAHWQACVMVTVSQSRWPGRWGRGCALHC